MTVSLLRGIFRVTAAVTGLLLVYGVVYAMEGMTTRLPISPGRELAITSLAMLPWALLFCSGMEDLGTAARRTWLFWVGSTIGLTFLYYLERYTTSSVVTKAAMPLLAAAGGSLPHLIRRMRFMFTLCSVAAGVAGLIVFYFAFETLFSPTTSFANNGIAALIVVFAATGTATGVLAVATLRARSSVG